MPARYSVTLPDKMGRVINNMAAHEGSKPTAAAAFILETAIKERLRSGEFPAEWAEAESGIESQGEIGDLALEILQSLITGQELDPSAIALAAKHFNVAPHELANKLQGGNQDGDRAVSGSNASHAVQSTGLGN